MTVVVRWWWPEEKDLDLRRCLYAYLDHQTDELLYLGKADQQSVRQRMSGRHKNDIYRYLERTRNLDALRPLVGELRLDQHQRYSGALLTDVESLLINRLLPPCNIACIRSRVSRPGLTVVCRGDWWPVRQRTYYDE